VRGRWRSLRIVGTAISPEYVYEIGPGALFPDNRRYGVLWMARPAVAAAFDLEGSFNDLALTLAPGAVERDVVARLDRLLARWGGRGAYGREEHVSHRFLADEIAETRITSILLPSIFLAVTAFLLHVVMSRLVALQREQIAVLAAFGYTRGAIAAHFLTLAALPVAAGAALGVGSGLWLANGLASVYARFFQFPDARFVPLPGVLAAAVSVAAGSALSGAVAAVVRAVRVAPAEAMHPEPPPRFRRSVLERTGLGRRLPLVARMVVRHLERRPWRAALAVLGTALGVAIVETGANLWAGIAVLEEVCFEQAQRQDLLVTLRRPRGPAAALELARLPGVLRVELFRNVAVEVGHGHRKRRLAAVGLPEDGELLRVVDGRRQVRRLPLDGALVTSKLAEVLGVEVGDFVAVSVLEGRRRTVPVQVAATADELLGMSLYVHPAVAWRLLGESERWNGALLAVDPAREAAVVDRLRRLPEVTGVAVRRSMVASFRATLAESFAISLGSLVTFACVIAGGIVYNAARIALSERGRELASLRVLGFTRAEVTTMLLGEQGAMLLLALPAGVTLGFGLCALVAFRFTTELYRLPLVLPPAAVSFSCGIVVAAAGASGWLVRRRIRGMDLVAVLKTRE
jgi:putative ABC transport system permease protein